VEHTLLHEMVHQWQAETGIPVDHGPTFRRKARQVGVLPGAKRSLRGSPSQPAASRGRPAEALGVVFSNQEIRELTSFTAIVETLGRRLDSVA
jgi:hypothetical protein